MTAQNWHICIDLQALSWCFEAERSSNEVESSELGGDPAYPSYQEAMI